VIESLGCDFALTNVFNPGEILHFMSSFCRYASPSLIRRLSTSEMSRGVRRSLSACGGEKKPLRIIDSAKAALGVVKSGDSVFVHGAAATPLRLLDGLVERAVDLRNVQLYHMRTMGEATYARPEHADSFFTNCLFVGANLRAAVIGSRRLYDFMHDNSSVLMLRVSDTNDPARIARNSNMCAINSCIEMDLSGQVRFCAECLRFQCMLLGLR
jgi:acyl-CoA hydrolase